MGWIACGKLHRGSTKCFSLGHAAAFELRSFFCQTGGGGGADCSAGPSAV
jgi:hypothetical protein